MSHQLPVGTYGVTKGALGAYREFQAVLDNLHIALHLSSPNVILSPLFQAVLDNLHIALKLSYVFNYLIHPGGQI